MCFKKLTNVAGIPRAVMAAVLPIAWTVCAGAADGDLPRSGSVKAHSGWVGIGEVKELGKDHLAWNGVFYGTSYNDQGKGFLEHMAWICPGTSDILNGTITHQGFCTLTDVDGDQIYGINKGSGPLTGPDFTGTVTYNGGTGKYAGIQGGQSYRCQGIGKHGQLFCTKEATYNLP
jgi:hypothetical protein